VSTIKVDAITDTSGNSSPIIKGAVIQVVNVTGTTTTAVTSESNVQVGVEAAITPRSSSSKIIVLCNAPVRWYHGDGGFTALHRKIASGSYSEIETFSRHTMYRDFDTGVVSGQHISFNYLDSPSTTDVVTYSWAMNRWTSGTSYFLPNSSSGDSQNWTLMEIGG